MKCVIGCDSAGFALKEELRTFLSDKGYDVTDFGVYATPEGVLTHYPQIAEKVASAVAAGEFTFGILLCGTGIGMSITANKIVGVRAAAVTNQFDAKYTRLHNDANVLCMGGRTTGAGHACEIALTFLQTPFSDGERHQLRVQMISDVETRHLEAKGDTK